MSSYSKSNLNAKLAMAEKLFPQKDIHGNKRHPWEQKLKLHN
jgi:hypothetical protein